MRSTRLILIEGIPGSGKSTTGQFLTGRLADAGVDVRWWYEEIKGHPLYIFDDEASMDAVVQDLFAGRFERVVEETLERWRQFAAWLQVFDGIAVLDSTFLGHITWTLFGFDAPAGALEDYVERVTEIISMANPVLMYVRHDDVRATMANVCAVRDEAWTKGTIRKAVTCPYGIRLGLTGFDGLVAYWQAYRHVSDRLVRDTSIPTLVVDTSDGDWTHHYDEIAHFLDLTAASPRSIRNDDLAAFVGSYTYLDKDVEKTCTISLENDELIAHDVPRLWPWNRLIRTSPDTFVAASFPIEIAFEQDGEGQITSARVRGPDMLDGPVDWVLKRR